MLTDRDFFQGSAEYLSEARAACELPVLRKDFIIDPYQVYEARAMGADCILLIVAALELPAMQALEALALELGMAVLVESHDAEELDAGAATEDAAAGHQQPQPAHLRGQPRYHAGLAAEASATSASSSPNRGILAPADVARMRSHQVNGFLVGEAFMRAADPGAELARLFA